ncbi:hypothetical protein RDI58_021294 [Solanum bulbocastanum]|uniref:Transcription factor n=1 Tax=Solanum bulbocastanum TaxID=147425 RepID=A0AAN8TE33_SOLBU
MINTLQKGLPYIIYSRQEGWIYGIFWQASKDANGRLLLSWGDGHFRDPKGKLRISNVVNNVNDTEMYYAVSAPECFVSNDDIIVQAYNSASYIWLDNNYFYKYDRSKEAYLHGLLMVLWN